MDIEEIKKAAGEAFGTKAADLKKDLEQQITALKSELAEAQKLNAKSEDVTKLVETVGSLSTIIDDLGVKMQNFGKGGENKYDSHIVDFANAVKSSVDEIFENGRVEPTKIKQVDANIELKTLGTMTTIVGAGNTFSAANLFLTRPELENMTYRAPKNPTVVLDLIPASPTNAVTIYNRVRTTTEGTPLTVAEAAAYPQSKLNWIEETTKVKKIGVFADFSAESIEDTDFIQSELPMELTEDMLIQLNYQVMFGDGTGNNLSGIYAVFATAFARQTGIGTLTGVTYAEVIRNAVLQLKKKNFKGTAIVINPSDAALMEFKDRDTTGQYKFPLFYVNANGETKVAGLPVIEDNNMTEGSFLVGDFSRAKLRVKRQLEYKLFDQDAQNAKNDLYTCTMSMRAALVCPTPNRVGFVKGTFATAITALQA